MPSTAAGSDVKLTICSGDCDKKIPENEVPGSIAPPVTAYTCAAADYSRNVGDLYVTDRFDLDMNWVLTANKNQFIEVTGNNLDIRRDRISVISCDGTCGVTEPTKALSQFPSIAAHSNHLAANNLIDAAATSDQVAHVQSTSVNDVQFNPPVLRKFCHIGSSLEMQGDIAKDLCQTKCADDSGNKLAKDGCSGFIRGYAAKFVYCPDGSRDDAVVAAKQACAGQISCAGFEFHRSISRVHFNSVEATNKCKAADVGLHSDKAYDYYSINSRGASSQSTSWHTPQAGTDLSKYSYDSKLIFQNYTFPSGGTFKVCGCDSSNQFSDQATFCRTKADYKIEIGKIHVSGVSCLVNQHKFQRGCCQQQVALEGGESSGLRCYSDACPTIPPPTPAAIAQVNQALAAAIQNDVDPQVRSSFCVYTPEEAQTIGVTCALV